MSVLNGGRRLRHLPRGDPLQGRPAGPRQDRRRLARPDRRLPRRPRRRSRHRPDPADRRQLAAAAPLLGHLREADDVPRASRARPATTGPGARSPTGSWRRSPSCPARRRPAGGRGQLALSRSRGRRRATGVDVPSAVHTYVVRTTQHSRSPTRTVKRTVRLVRPSVSSSASTSTVSPQRADERHSSALATTKYSTPRGVELAPGHAAADPPGVHRLVGPDQVVGVEDDALLVALDEADGGTPDAARGARYPAADTVAAWTTSAAPPTRTCWPATAPPSQRVLDKVIHRLDEHCAAFIGLVAVRDAGHRVGRRRARGLAPRRRPGLRAGARRAPARAARPAGQQPGRQPAQPRRQPAGGADVLRARHRRDAAGLRDDDAARRPTPSASTSPSSAGRRCRCWCCRSSGPTSSARRRSCARACGTRSAGWSGRSSRRSPRCCATTAATHDPRRGDAAGRPRAGALRTVGGLPYRPAMAFDFQVTIDSSARTSSPTGGPRRSAGRSSRRTRRSSARMVETGAATEADTRCTAARWSGRSGAALNSPDPGRPAGALPARPEPKTVKNRVHLDVRVGADRGRPGRPAARRWARRSSGAGSQGPYEWATLADPEGNEFCVT